MSVLVFDEELKGEKASIVDSDGDFVRDAESANAGLDQGDAVPMRRVLVAQEGCRTEK